MKEKTIENKIKAWLKQQPCLDVFFFKVHGSPYQLRGLPDIVGNVRRFAFYMEIKQPGKKLTPLQLARRMEIEKTGAYYAVVHSLEEAKDFIKKIREHPRF